MTQSLNAVPPSVGVFIPACNGAGMLARLLPMIQGSALKPKILVIDSSSDDGTADVARKLGVETIVIDRKDFSHGGTRELARKRLATDIVVMMTQDVVPAGPDLLEKLIAPIVAGNAAVSYARQIPRDGAGFLEAFPRQFNYPAESELRGMEDVKRYGAYTFFCSDSCAAWSCAALEEIGGFAKVVSLEDTIGAAMLLRRGHKIAYCADAVVKHSHCYTLAQEYRRYVVTGYVRAMYRDLLFVAGGDEARGASFVKVMLGQLCRHRPWLVPYAIMSAGAKWIGYRIGRRRALRGSDA